jgi:hypothetical protein
MGEPGKGVPVCSTTGHECPSSAFQRNTILNMTVFGYVLFVVKNNEIAMLDLPECGEHCQRKKETNQQLATIVWYSMKHRKMSLKKNYFTSKRGELHSCC